MKYGDSKINSRVVSQNINCYNSLVQVGGLLKERVPSALHSVRRTSFVSNPGIQL